MSVPSISKNYSFFELVFTKNDLPITFYAQARGTVQRLAHWIENTLNKICFGKKIWVPLELSDKSRVDLYIPSLVKSSFKNLEDEFQQVPRLLTIEKLFEIISSVSTEEEKRCQFLLASAKGNLESDPMAKFWEE
jgi:hypothetical protein